MAGFGAGIMMPPIIQRFIIDTSGVNAAAAQMSGRMSAISQNMAAAGSSMSRNFTLPIAAGVAVGVKKYAELEKALLVTAQIAKNGEGRFEDLRDKAIELGKALDLPNVTAQEAAVTMQTLAKAGFDVEAAMKAARGALQFKVAAEMDAESATDLLSNVLVTFNLGADQAERAANTLVAAADSSIMSADEMAVSLKYAGLSAATYGMTLEETAAAIGVLSNAGLQGSTAGTQLRMMLQKLTSPTRQSEQALMRLGIKTKDAAGQMLPLGNIVDQFFESFQGADEATQAMAAAEFLPDENQFKQMLQDMRAEGKLTADQLDELNKIFEVRGGSAARGLILAKLREDSDTGKSYDQILAEITGNTEAVENKLKAMMAGVWGEIEKFKNQWDTFLTNLGQSIQGPAKVVLGIGTAIFGFFNNASEGTRTFITGVLVAIAVLGPLMILAAKLITGFRVVASVFNKTGKAAQLIGNAVQGPAQQAGNASRAFGTLKNTFVKLSTVAPVVADAFQKLDGPMTRVSKAVRKSAPAFERFRDAVKGGLNKTLNTLGDRMGKLAKHFPTVATAAPKVATAMDNIAREARELMLQSNGMPSRLKTTAEGFRSINTATRYMVPRLGGIATNMGRVALQADAAATANFRLAQSFTAVAGASGMPAAGSKAAAAGTAGAAKGGGKGGSGKGGGGGGTNVVTGGSAKTAKNADKATKALKDQTGAATANAKAADNVAKAQTKATDAVKKNSIVVRKVTPQTKAMQRFAEAQRAMLAAPVAQPNPRGFRNPMKPAPSGPVGPMPKMGGGNAAAQFAGYSAMLAPQQEQRRAQATKSFQNMSAAMQGVDSTGSKAAKSVQSVGGAAAGATGKAGALSKVVGGALAPNMGFVSAQGTNLAGSLAKTATSAGTAAQKTGIFSRILSFLPGRSAAAASSTQNTVGAFSRLAGTAGAAQGATSRLGQTAATKLAPNLGFATVASSNLVGSFTKVGTTSAVTGGKVGAFSRILGSGVSGGAGLASRAIGGAGKAMSGLLGILGLSPQFALVAALVGGAVWVIANWDKVKSFFGDLFNNLKTGFGSLWSSIFGGGKNTARAFSKGMASESATVKKTAETLAGYSADYLVGRSPPPKGPLSNIDEGGKNIMDAWVAGMTQASQKPMTAYLKQAQEAFKAVQDRIRDDIRQAQADASKLKRAIDDIDFQFADAFNSIDDDARDVARVLARLNKQADQIKLKFDEQTKQIQMQLDELENVETLEQKRQRNALNLQRNGLKTQIVMAGQNDSLRESLEQQLDSIDNQLELLDLEVEKKRLQNEQLAIPLEDKLRELNRQQNEQLLPLQNQIDLYQIQEDSLKEMRDELEYQVDLRKRGLEKELDLIERKIALLQEEKNLNDIMNPSSSPVPMGPDPLVDYGNIGGVDIGDISGPEVEMPEPDLDPGAFADYKKAARDMLKSLDITGNLDRDVEDVAKALAKMERAGMDSTQANVAMLDLLTKMKSGKYDTMFRAMGAGIRDADGKMRPLGDTFKRLQDYGPDIAETFDLVGVEAGKAMLVVSNGNKTTQEHIDLWDQLDRYAGASQQSFFTRARIGAKYVGDAMSGTSKAAVDLQREMENTFLRSRRLMDLPITTEVQRAFGAAAEAVKPLAGKIGSTAKARIVSAFAGISDEMAANFNSWPIKARTAFVIALADLDTFTNSVLDQMNRTAVNGKTAYGVPLEEAKNEVIRITNETQEKLKENLGKTPEEARINMVAIRKAMIEELAKVSPEAALTAARTKEEFDLALAKIPPSVRDQIAKVAPEMMEAGKNLPTEAQVLADQTQTGFLSPINNMPGLAYAKAAETATGIKSGLGQAGIDAQAEGDKLKNIFIRIFLALNPLAQGIKLGADFVKGIWRGITGGDTAKEAADGQEKVRQSMRGVRTAVEEETKGAADAANRNLAGINPPGGDLQQRTRESLRGTRQAVEEETKGAADAANKNLGSINPPAADLQQRTRESMRGTRQAVEQETQAAADVGRANLDKVSPTPGAAQQKVRESLRGVAQATDEETKKAADKGKANLDTIEPTAGRTAEKTRESLRGTRQAVDEETDNIAASFKAKLDFFPNLLGLAVSNAGDSANANFVNIRNTFDTSGRGLVNTAGTLGSETQSALLGNLGGMQEGVRREGELVSNSFSAAVGGMPASSLFAAKTTVDNLDLELGRAPGSAGMQGLLTSAAWQSSIREMDAGSRVVFQGVRSSAEQGLAGVSTSATVNGLALRLGWLGNLLPMAVETAGALGAVRGFVGAGLSAAASEAMVQGGRTKVSWLVHMGELAMETGLALQGLASTVREAFSFVAQTAAASGNAARDGWRFALQAIPVDTTTTLAGLASTVRDAFSFVAQTVVASGNAARDVWRFAMQAIPVETGFALQGLASTVREAFSFVAQAVVASGGAARDGWRFAVQAIPMDTTQALMGLVSTFRDALTVVAQVVGAAGNASRDGWRFAMQGIPADTTQALMNLASTVRDAFTVVARVVGAAGNASRDGWRFAMQAMPTETMSALTILVTNMRQAFQFVAQLVNMAGNSMGQAWRFALWALRNDTDAALDAVGALVRNDLWLIASIFGQGGDAIRSSWRFVMTSIEFETRGSLSRVANEFTRLRLHAEREMALMQQSSQRGGGGVAQGFWNGFKRLWFGSPISRAEKEMIAARNRMPGIWEGDVVQSAGATVAGGFWQGFENNWNSNVDTELVRSEGYRMGEALTEGLNNGFAGLNDAALSNEMMRAVAVAGMDLTTDFSARATAVNALPSDKFATAAVAAPQAAQQPIVNNTVNLTVEKMEVRNDEDIVRISRELEALLRRQQRYSGSARV